MKIDFKFLSNIFTKRNEEQLNSLKPLTQDFRYRVRQLCADTFSEEHRGYFDNIEPFWLEIHKRLNYLNGSSITSSEYSYGSPRGVDKYLINCDDGRFLDFIELIFQVRIVLHNHGYSWNAEHRRSIIESINQFFQMDDLPYDLTQYIYRTYDNAVGVIVGTDNYDSFGIVKYPQVILRENDVIHSSAVRPALTLLSNPVFSSANTEFLGALQHYRKGEYGDCLTKVASSMESTMKIICDQRGWHYNQSDTFSKLLDIVFQQSSLDSFLKQPIMQIGTFRNKFSSSHGAGVQNNNVQKHRAQFAINISASSIILLISESGLTT